ncbi:hypothetical protein Ataiwa_31860 [Algoriphagus taiwanensis]|uniref:Uncharacterized protein n=1 Tax=Algoriphagus taiwanensis TaxID=1445656 RepID=A0ABQ6Q604_9BACT|nr:hypothetical protein Ataiwa_31860 [Algoriphagus taiwanensis]
MNRFFHFLQKNRKLLINKESNILFKQKRMDQIF